MFDLPGVVVAELVREHDLRQRFVEQVRLIALVPGLGQLVLVENPEAHGVSPCCVLVKGKAGTRDRQGGLTDAALPTILRQQVKYFHEVLR